MPYIFREITPLLTLLAVWMNLVGIALEVSQDHESLLFINADIAKVIAGMHDYPVTQAEGHCKTTQYICDEQAKESCAHLLPSITTWGLFSQFLGLERERLDEAVEYLNNLETSVTFFTVPQRCLSYFPVFIIFRFFNALSAIPRLASHQVRGVLDDRPVRLLYCCVRHRWHCALWPLR